MISLGVVPDGTDAGGVYAPVEGSMLPPADPVPPRLVHIRIVENRYHQPKKPNGEDTNCRVED